MQRVLVVVAMGALVGSTALAVPRTWKSANGKFSTDAELVDFQDGKAHLKKEDGRIIQVPLLSLSPEDRQQVKSQFPGVEGEQFRPGAEYREWKSKSGKFSVLAEFQGSADGHVQLRKPDGSDISVEKKLLSTDDQRWVTDELRRRREEEEESKTLDKTASPEVTEPLAAQEIPMKLIRLDPPTAKAKGSKAGVPIEYLLRLTQPQTSYVAKGPSASAADNLFRRVVTKEPKYNSSNPFRGVARLGGREFGFALDAVGSQAGYNTLRFDVNGNGDLTDDKPLKALNVSSLSARVSQSQFPRVDLTLDADGKTTECSVLLSVVSHQADGYTSVSIYSGAVREGFISQGAKRTKLLLVDHNSNGRFDDLVTARGGSVAEGDLLLVNPNPRDRLSADATMGRDRNFVSKTICIGKSFYKMELPPAGDRLMLTPAKIALGNVTNPSPAYRAVLSSAEHGTVLLSGTKDQKMPLPEGAWKLVNYTVDATASAGGPRTAVAAAFPDPATVSVDKGDVARMAFGAPYHAVVTARRIESGKVALALAVVGVAGENCTSLYVNGGRPPKPKFVIKDESGKAVHQGEFEWG